MNFYLKKTFIAIAILPLAGCQTTTASVCDGWQRLTPSSTTRPYIIANDKPFTKQIAAHNTFGVKQGCW